MIEEILENIQVEQAIILMAPPGWGKTYKLLQAIKKSQRKCLFVFPLRALCDEVYINASRAKINVCNIRRAKDFEYLSEMDFQLVVSTPECLKADVIEALAQDHVFILDESHLIKLWGETFRPKLVDFLELMQTYAPPTLLLSATMAKDNLAYMEAKLRYHYKDIYHIDLGNLSLKNIPSKVYVYPSQKKNWLIADIIASIDGEVSLIFCQYRKEVKKLDAYFRSLGLRVLSCVGGEAQKFIQELNTSEKPDIIISTSVLGHGVNLPSVKRVYFLYRVKGVEFYLQMLGRGGRNGSSFFLHTMNWNYFPLIELFRGMLRAYLKSIRNRVNYFLYYSNAY